LSEDKKKASKSKTVSKAKPKAIKVTEKNLHDYLGVRRFDYGVAESENRIGQVTGLAWTEVGGELSSPTDSARERTTDHAADTDSFMTSPSWPVH
jgi:ATP-dependent Lon protease